MANSKAIEIKGIVRNQTKIGVQDGQCDDLVNLKFKDGSWRVSADGKVMLDADSGMPFNTYGYTQLYVHTNVYHHLLGVKNGKLWWFANIDVDNESFTFVKDANGLPAPIEICDVQGDVTIVQNGHLLTIIGSDKSSANYAIFKSGTNEYKELKVNPNGGKTDRELYPFGRVHLNLNCESKEFTVEDKEGKNGYILLDADGTLNGNESGALCPQGGEDTERTLIAKQLWHSQMLEAFKKAQDDNAFTRPILALVALKMYDGSYIYASEPILLNPRERLTKYTSATIADYGNESTSAKDITFQRQGAKIGTSTEQWEGTGHVKYTSYKVDVTELCYSSAGKYKTNKVPVYISGASSARYRNADNSLFSPSYARKAPMVSSVYGSSLIMTLGDISTIIDNNDVFVGVSIFITKEVDIYKMAANDYKDGSIKIESGNNKGSGYVDGAKEGVTIWGNIMYKPAVRADEEIIYDLMHSPFYLLREFNINELKTMSNTSIEVDLSGVEYKGVLSNIEQQPILDAEAFDRKDFFPKTAYQYNAKLHIGNYKSNQFHGYPIDCFHLSNHNVKIKGDSYAVGGALPNLEEGLDVQYTRNKMYFAQSAESHHSDEQIAEYIGDAKEHKTFFAAITTTIETQQGDQKVVRYIEPYDSNYTNAGELGLPASFIESLGSLLVFPDYRATKMLVEIVQLYEGKVTKYYKTFVLKPHQYLNVSYYIDSELKPINIYDFNKVNIGLGDFSSGHSNIDDFVAPNESNDTEEYPNGLKVSMTNNPFVFPNASTYQVGSSEIVALMSNAVAVGTGQTGAAPLYVFCKDGVYALIVDSTGEMTYTNARIIARDVCNNPKSVTPIDNGVVFTTDRGLMSIAGSEVIELGAAAEGDVFDITDTSDKAKNIMFNAFKMDKLGALPQELLDNVDFLTYIKGAIINYDHNDRELMVSNPYYDYTYIVDRNGQWSRRDFKAVEYVNNYPTSYRVKDDNLYKVDVEENVRGNCYMLSNVIKLGTIAFKQAYRLVVRGYFETNTNTSLGCYVFGSYDGRKWALLGGNEKQGKFTDIGCNISHTDVKFLRICVSGQLSSSSRIDFVEIEADGSVLNNKLR